MNITNPTKPQVFSDSENNQPYLISHYVPQEDNGILTVSPPIQETRLNENADHVIGDAPHLSPSHNPINDIQPAHPTVFFYRPPNHFYHYHVNCEEIPYDAIEGLLNDRENVALHREDEYVFFYQQKCDNRFYRVSCEIAPPLLVNSCLNNNYLGIELQNQNMEQEYLTFTLGQKEDLKYHLKQYLSHHFLN